MRKKNAPTYELEGDEVLALIIRSNGTSTVVVNGTVNDKMIESAHNALRAVTPTGGDF